MKSLYESILSKAGVGVVKRLVPHFNELVEEYAHHIIVEQVETIQQLGDPRKDKNFPHDSKVFQAVYGNLEKKLPVSKKDIFSEYFKKIIQQQHSLRDSYYKSSISMDIREECQFALMYIFYIFYKLESTNVYKLQQHGRKAKVLNQIINAVNNEIGCGFMRHQSTTDYPEAGMGFNFDASRLGFSEKEYVDVKVKWTSFIH